MWGTFWLREDGKEIAVEQIVYWSIDNLGIIS
jgi:hypothetical protein